MRYNRLGTTGLFVSEFCLGTMTFGTPAPQYAAAGGVQQETMDQISARAFDAGINFIDTANVYSGGQAETMVGQTLKKHGVARHDVVIATKAGHATGSGPNDGGSSHRHLIQQAKESLKRLGTDYIDLYQLHGWDPVTPVEETLRALDDLVRQGHVRYVGVSNWAAWQVSKALGISDKLNLARFQSYQGYYSLIGRDVEREVVPMLESEGLGLIAFSPLAGGYLTGKYRVDAKTGRRASIQFPPVDEVRGQSLLSAMDAVASARDVSLESVALAWMRHKRSVTSTILGVKSVDQLERNLQAIDLSLSDEEINALEATSSLAFEYPGWMIANDSAARQRLLETGIPEHARVPRFNEPATPNLMSGGK
ncbi:aldo/keto reductase [Pseudomonas lijiangensis]|uniref:Aldo/keto reductase n=1 Tax=Pseudomonas lijiangensis TaxID=2995658 RepID=A0ABX8HR29_9PSED|nr:MULTISPECIES: aldo/keto reductase [Pseudomonas syringae group]MBX8489642.1 aldo/keto reductase [Pseudomonas cichorii]MBX8500178.1 aldo/keto reductase [Pseudomonas lijiangensis]MBX8505429.1 aldo/keto reductase [Pseudomonas lijiangensis]QWU82490.1 aldo/keto reductase [Pseudomonas lijiangensis]